ncbi:MAG: two-component sensor histidine kinase [Oscillospiraceae bacterium]|nr:two-component sensor histidine kinase [Oscillospiraceae bacterium]
MVRTIFRNTILVGSTVLLLCAALFFGLEYTRARDETYEALRQEAVYVEKGILTGGRAYLENLADFNRVTWTDGGGEVLYDSHFPNGLPKQGSDAEMQAAMSIGEGQSIRRSESSGETTMYYARRCADGTLLRLSRPLRAINEALTSVSLMLWVLILLLLISIVLSFRAAKQIVQPVNAMDLDDPTASPYPELVPLVERIREQSQTIREETEQREQLRKEFSANVSHELKTPLTSISGFAELMSQGLVPPEKIPEFSRDIYRESQRLIDLVDDIIRLSRLDENAVEPDWEQVDLYDLSGDVLDSLRPTAERQNVSLRLQGEHITVRGVWRLLSEMVYNLCDNAIKYNRPGGRVTVTVNAEAKGARLAVSDTGIGIPKNRQDRVFERFYRVDKSHSRELGGTGLGLSIVKHGAQFHGADIRLESMENEGTTITLSFSEEPGIVSDGAE